MTTPGTTPTDDLALGPTYHLLDTGAAGRRGREEGLHCI